MKMLNDRAIRHYHQQGYHAPSASCRDQAASLCVRLESFEAGARILAGKLRHKSHLQFDWPNDLVRHPRILDAVEDVIGPNIVCWCSSFFIKETRNPRFVSWHQDSTHWGLDPADAVTACRCRRCARGTRGLRRHPHERHSGLPTSTAVGRTAREFPDKPRHEILSEIEWTLSRATPGDLVLIYYSGHGKLDRNGRVCLATLDTEEGALQATSITARHLTDLVNQSDCDHVVLMLDCCYSGAVDDLRGDVSSEMHVIEDALGV